MNVRFRRAQDLQTFFSGFSLRHLSVIKSCRFWIFGSLFTIVELGAKLSRRVQKLLARARDLNGNRTKLRDSSDNKVRGLKANVVIWRYSLCTSVIQSLCSLASKEILGDNKCCRSNVVADYNYLNGIWFVSYCCKLPKVSILCSAELQVTS